MDAQFSSKFFSFLTIHRVVVRVLLRRVRVRTARQGFLVVQREYNPVSEGTHDVHNGDSTSHGQGPGLWGRHGEDQRVEEHPRPAEGCQLRRCPEVSSDHPAVSDTSRSDVWSTGNAPFSSIVRVMLLFFFFPSPVTGLASWNHFVVATFGNGCIDVIDTLNLVLTARVNAHAK